MHSSGMKLSAARKTDLKKLIEVYSSPELKGGTGEASWFVNCYFDYHHVILAKMDGDIIGACFWRIEGERKCGLGWIENIWVDETCRRAGLGEALLRRSVEDMKALYKRDGIVLRHVLLATQVERTSARKLYEKVGFRVLGRLGDLYDHDERDLMYLLEVQRS